MSAPAPAASSSSTSRGSAAFLFPLYPRAELPVLSGAHEECAMDKAPVWSNLRALEFMPCITKSSRHHALCFTFELNIPLTVQALKPLMVAVSATAQKQLTRAVQLLQVMQTNFCVCDIVPCVVSAHDCKSHGQMIQYIQHVFLFVGRVFLSMESFLSCHPETSRLMDLPLAPHTIVQRILVSYASWLYHISYYTHLFSNISLVTYLRVGYTWITGAMDVLTQDADGRELVSPSSTSSASTMATNSSTPHSFDRADLISVLMMALKTRIFELDDVHTRLLAFCIARSDGERPSERPSERPAAPHTPGEAASSATTDPQKKKNTFALRKEERSSVREFIEHLGHLMDAQSQFARILKGFLTEGDTEREGFVSPGGAGGGRAPSGGVGGGGAPSSPSCLPTWLYTLEVDQCRTAVLFYALILLYTEHDQQNICLAASQHFDVALADVARASNPKEHRHRTSASCVFSDPPHEFNFNKFAGNVTLHSLRIEPVLRRQVDALRALHDTNMPNITNIQVHVCINLSPAAWDARSRKRNAEITHDDSVDNIYFSY